MIERNEHSGNGSEIWVSVYLSKNEFQQRRQQSQWRKSLQYVPIQPGTPIWSTTSGIHLWLGYIYQRACGEKMESSTVFNVTDIKRIEYLFSFHFIISVTHIVSTREKRIWKGWKTNGCSSQWILKLATEYSMERIWTKERYLETVWYISLFGVDLAFQKWNRCCLEQCDKTHTHTLHVHNNVEWNEWCLMYCLMKESENVLHSNRHRFGYTHHRTA